MALKDNDLVTYIDLTVTNDGPLRIGNEEDILIDKVSNRPYLPGTSFAGAFRSYIRENNDNNIAEKIFGNGDNESKIVIFDSIAKNKKEIELRPGVRIDNKLGINKKGGFFERQYLVSGHEFKIRIKMYSKNEEEQENMLKVIKAGINGIHSGNFRIGGHKTNGAGILYLKDVEICELNLKDKKDLAIYLEDKYENKLVSIKDEIINIKNKDNYVEFKINCTCDTPILIKGKGNLNHNMPDGTAIQDSNGEYYIPGSSIKGSFRNGFSKISKFKNVEELVNESFGKDGGTEQEKSMGRVYFQDIKVKNSLDKAIYNRIKIDKFTGGVRQGAVLNDKPIKGNLEFKINYKLFDKEEKNNKIIALIIYSIKDLLEGVITLGSGNSIGRGKLKGDKIQFIICGEEYIIDLKGNNHLNKTKIEKILASIN